MKAEIETKEMSDDELEQNLRKFEGDLIIVKPNDLARIRRFEKVRQGQCDCVIEYPDSYQQEIYSFPGDFISSRIRFGNIAEQKEMFSLLNRLFADQPGKTRQTLSRIPQYTSVDDFYRSYSFAIQKEIYKAKRDAGRRNKLLFGVRDPSIKNQNYKCVYLFQLEQELNVPSNSLISIFENHAEYEGFVLECVGQEITIATEHDFGDNPEKLEFASDLSWIHFREGEELEKVCKNPNRIVRELILGARSHVRKNDSMIRKGQKTAIEASMKDEILCIWGPPGTGKTTTLARMILEKMKAGERILFVSFSNVSVDTALKKLIDADRQTKEIRPGRVLRYGNPKLSEVVDHPFLTADRLNQPARDHYNKIIQKTELIKSKKNPFRSSQEAAVILKKLADAAKCPDAQSFDEIAEKAREQIKKLPSADEYARKAQVIFATVAGLMISRVLQDNYDTVIFDEISMASLPNVMIAAQRAQKHFIILGDFYQLPPVAGGILALDVFRYLGICEAVERRQNHDWLVMLDTQYRMGSQIADFINTHVYGEQLITAPGLDQKLKPVVESDPFPDHQIIIADCSGMMTCCKILPSFSRVNILSALIAASLGLQGARTQKTAIITPYRIQALLIQNICSDLYEAGMNHRLKKIEASTVHQFQGSESDVVILDLTDCYRAPYVSGLLSGTVNKLADRLLNVSVSRAKGKLIVLVNMDYFNSRLNAKNLILSKLLPLRERRQVTKFHVISGADLENQILGIDQKMQLQKLEVSAANRINLPPIPADEIFPVPVFRTYQYSSNIDRPDNPWRQFLKDIQNAKKSIRMDLPGKIEDSNALDLFIRMLLQKKNSLKVIIRSENIQSLPAELQRFAEENRNAVDPIAVIDQQIVWYGMPRHLGKFVLKNGKVIPSNRWPIFRLEGRFISSGISSLLEMRETDNGVYRIEELSDALISRISRMYCPDCGHPFELVNRNGHSPFIGCSDYPACVHREKITEELMNEVIRKNHIELVCPVCNEGHLHLRKDKRNKLYFQCDRNSEDNFTLQEVL